MPCRVCDKWSTLIFHIHPKETPCLARSWACDSACADVLLTLHTVPSPVWAEIINTYTLCSPGEQYIRRAGRLWVRITVRCPQEPIQTDHEGHESHLLIDCYEFITAHTHSIPTKASGEWVNHSRQHLRRRIQLLPRTFCQHSSDFILRYRFTRDIVAEFCFSFRISPGWFMMCAGQVLLQKGYPVVKKYRQSSMRFS